MKKLAGLFIGIYIVTNLISCKPSVDNCPDKWVVNKKSEDLLVEIDSVANSMSIQIENVTPAMGGYIMGDVVQSYFTGDFNIQAPFSNFISPAPSAGNGRSYVEMILRPQENPLFPLADTGIVVAGIASNFIYVRIGSQFNFAYKSAITNSGTFRIQKIGPSVLAEVRTAADTITMVKTFSILPYYCGFRLGGYNDSSVVGQTAIKINQFNVSGTSDATLYSDEFRCNSIYIP